MAASSKSNTPAPPVTTTVANAIAAASQTAKPAKQESARETIESIAVAFLLAFLFRAFEAEAFVIPTGSMAPTLYGRHKEMNCTQCGHLITIGASEEVDDNGYLRSRIDTSLCPNCRAPNAIRNAPAFKGDRILVNKFPYELKEPQRWDVVVFKYPEEPKTNYIKRLVGLPNETLIIRQGDLYRAELGGHEENILRKDDPNKQRDVQILVYDNNYPEKPLIEQGWPRRWAAVKKATVDSEAAATGGTSPGLVAGWQETGDGWQSLDEAHAFALQGDAANRAEAQWLRYRHFVPPPEVWREVLPPDEGEPLRHFGANGADALKNPKPQLVTDFCGYNASSVGHHADPDFWVGDLSVACEVRIAQLTENPELLLELNEGVHRFRCRIDPKTGEAQLQRVVWLNSTEDWEVLAKATTSFVGTGTHHIEFANIDQRLCLWIDGSLIDFGSKAEYTLTEVANLGPQDEDLTPVGIAARGMGVEVSHLQIHRDIYYRSNHISATMLREQDEWEHCSGTSPSQLRSLLSDPVAWGEAYKACSHDARFDIGPDEFMMLGDNSPRSKDSRLWSNLRQAEHRHAVPRSALVGKAFYIYWPHGVPFLNGGEGFPVWYHKQWEPRRRADDSIVTDAHGNAIMEKVKTDYPDIRVPFYPNVGRMQRIR